MDIGLIVNISYNYILSFHEIDQKFSRGRLFFNKFLKYYLCY
jgi:hypothetical protein